MERDGSKRTPLTPGTGQKLNNSPGVVTRQAHTHISHAASTHDQSGEMREESDANPERAHRTPGEHQRSDFHQPCDDTGKSWWRRKRWRRCPRWGGRSDCFQKYAGSQWTHNSRIPVNESDQTKLGGAKNACALCKKRLPRSVSFTLTVLPLDIN